MPFENIRFENQHSELLSARLDLPVEGKPSAYAIFAHCFTCSKNLSAVGHISKAMTRNGLAVLRFDFTGLGESEGDFANTNFSSNIGDLLEAAHFLREYYEAPSILVGHSLGGAAVLQAAKQLPEVRAVATIGAPYDPAHVQHLFESSTNEIIKTGKAVVNLAGRQFTIKRQFLDDLETQRVESTLRSLNRALLIFHSPVDKLVSVDNAAKIFQAARHPKSFVSLDEADHLLTTDADSLYVGTVLAAWAQKYIDTTGERVMAHQTDEDHVVAYIGNSGFRTDIYASGHALIVDEPLSVGGTNLGPTPYDLLSASLGACTVMTMRMYADRKGWPLESVTARLQHSKSYAKDCENCETEGSAKIDQIEREIQLAGPLDEAQRKRLMEIADRCPVHRTMHSEIRVVTREHRDGPFSTNG